MGLPQAGFQGPQGLQRPRGVREGFYSNDNRLDQLERERNIKYNLGKHLLHWQAPPALKQTYGMDIGSQEEGWLQCLHPRPKWRWKDRVTIMPWSRCMGGSDMASAGRSFVGCHGPKILQQDAILQFCLLKCQRVSDSMGWWWI